MSDELQYPPEAAWAMRCAECGFVSGERFDARAEAEKAVDDLTMVGTPDGGMEREFIMPCPRCHLESKRDVVQVPRD